MEVKQILIYFHHPGQFFRNTMDPFLSGPYHKMANNIQLQIRSLSVIQKRKYGISCHDERFNDDKIVMEKVAKIFNCTAKYPG